MQVKTYTAVDGTNNTISIPRLHLHKEAVGNYSLTDRVTALGRIEEPIFIVCIFMRLKCTILVAIITLINICRVLIGIELTPRVIFKKVSDIYSRELCHREVSISHSLQRNTDRLLYEEGVVAVEVIRLSTCQTHRHTRRHLKDSVGNSPFTHNTTILLLVDKVVHICRMDRVSATCMGKGCCKVLIFNSRAVILTL